MLTAQWENVKMGSKPALMMMVMVVGTAAERYSPTWRTLTPFPQQHASSVNSDGDSWPWWWPIAVIAVSVLLVAGVSSAIACFLISRARGRSSSAEVENDDNNLVSLRKISDSSAFRQLKDVVSIASWGSDFDPRVSARPQTTLYSVPQNSRRGAGRGANCLVVPGEKSQYANLSSAQYANADSLHRQ